LLNYHPINLKREKRKLLPANAILLRDAGTIQPNFKKINGSWTAVVGMPLEKGIAEAVGMKIIKVDYPELKSTDVYQHLFDELSSEIKTSRSFLESGKIKNTYFHFKETDIPGHDGLASEKKKMIEKLDREFFSYLLKSDLRDTIICITSDHCTPSELKSHASDPVPALVYIPGEQSDKIIKFGEKYCKRGSLKMTGSSLFKYLIAKVK